MLVIIGLLVINFAVAFFPLVVVDAGQLGIDNKQQAKQAKFLVEKARSEAEANAVKEQSITPEILQQRALEKWDGRFPKYWGVTSPLPFINLNAGQ